ncbi:DUF305 domain-containing protein [Nesterenkonia lutea]|uniref:DUF305 domain-containing protein n=1 Tax=Nesterenkonia lutea TaxID=272919 RepID=A0ABR9JBP6_9MICC|nr:DUF305 domain-containing protein [Nesterenkonia lutea]MBE1523357.1 hypothetical protein [Nesterenkonia lutea]
MTQHSDDTQHHGHESQNGHDSKQSHHQMKMYLRFGAMILTGMVVMYGLMFVSTWEWSHVRLSESRMIMALTMGGAMGLVMFAWMMNMYKNTKANIAVVVISVLLLGTGVVLDRSQVTVQDTAYMKSMIPHHSMAITRSERANFDDVRVCELAVAISEAQRREIAEMDWLIEDINSNGAATTVEDAEARPVPEYDDTADLECPTD